MAKEYQKGKITPSDFLGIVDYLERTTPYAKGEFREQVGKEPLEQLSDVLVEHISEDEKLKKVLKLIQML